MVSQAKASRGWSLFDSPSDLATTVATIGVIAAGAALFEAALIPGLAIGAAAVLTPRVFRAATGQQRTKRASRTNPIGAAEAPSRPALSLQQLRPGRALAKTVTFRIIVTTLDFSVNYLILRSFTTAAGLSVFSLVAGPFFYFLHETAWNYFGDKAQLSGAPDERVIVLSLPMSRALAKTITFRIMATTAEFTTNYVVVQDLATAALLSSFGFFLGPFVYYAHERAWDVFIWPEPSGAPGAAVALLPPPARAQALSA
jgi:uncharacterized membrane protein